MDPLRFEDIISKQDQHMCAHARADLKSTRKWYNLFFFQWIEKLVAWLDEA